MIARFSIILQSGVYNQVMRAVFLDPYLDSMGGGEKYMLDIALALKKNGYDVSLLWRQAHVHDAIIKRFGKEYGTISIDTTWHNASLLSRINYLRNADVFFYQPDGSYPLPLAKKNVALLQVPNKELIGGNQWYQRFKRSRFIPVYNSRFVKRFFDNLTPQSKGFVLYPIVTDNYFAPLHDTKKEKLIISVGRFFQHLHAKKQEVLIRAFQFGIKKYSSLRYYKLVLIGGCKIEDEPYVTRLRSLIGTDPRIELRVNLPYELIVDYYRRAQFYWHAAGYGESEHETPMRVEHFGISICEAMAAGAVAVAYKAGGPKETILHDKTGFLYTNRRDLAGFTATLIKKPKKYAILQSAGQKRAREMFSYKALNSSLQKLSLI